MDLKKLTRDLEQRLIEARETVLRQEGALLLARQLLAEQQAKEKIEEQAEAKFRRISVQAIARDAGRVAEEAKLAEDEGTDWE